MKHDTLRIACLAACCLLAAGAGAADLTAADRSFLSDAATSNQKEIDVSKLAQKQAASASVKQFAGQMVRDHGKLGATMKAKFGSAAAPGAPPPASELSGKAGKDFDKAYMDLMVSDHAAVQSKFEQAASGPDHGDAVHKAAAHALTTIKHHGEMARSIQSKL